MTGAVGGLSWLAVRRWSKAETALYRNVKAHTNKTNKANEQRINMPFEGFRGGSPDDLSCCLALLFAAGSGGGSLDLGWSRLGNGGTFGM